MTRQTREDWAQRIQRFKDSGLTAKQFAAEMGLNVHTLTHWKWRLSRDARRTEERRSHQTVDIGNAFVEVVGPIVEDRPGARALKTSAAAATPFELVLRNGLLLRIPAHFNEASLRQVISLLESR